MIENSEARAIKIKWSDERGVTNGFVYYITWVNLDGVVTLRTELSPDMAELLASENGVPVTIA